MKDLEKKLRSWVWHRLVFLADRISPEDAFRYTSYSMRLRKGHGWVFEEHDGKNGVKLWYKGSREYNEHSHDRYDEAVTSGVMSTGPGGINISSAGLSDEDVDKLAKSALWWGLVQR